MRDPERHLWSARQCRAAGLWMPENSRVQSCEAAARDFGILDGADLAIPLCFATPAATTRLNADWPERVMKYRGRQNTDETISEKASVLTAYVVHNLGVGTEVSKDVLKDEREINDGQELSVKVEEACLWYRLIDEAAYLAIPEQRSRFMDFFEDGLAEQLALQGAEPATICRTLSARSEEYGPYREWVSSDPDNMAGTLFWNAAKRIGAPIGFSAFLLVREPGRRTRSPDLQPVKNRRNRSRDRCEWANLAARIGGSEDAALRILRLEKTYKISMIMTSLSHYIGRAAALPSSAPVFQCRADERSLIRQRCRQTWKRRSSAPNMPP